MSLCSATGNAGFPVVIQGDIERAGIINKKLQKMTFKTSLSQRSVPRTYDPITGFIDELAGQDTFVFNSIPYVLQAVQIYNIRNQDTPLPTLQGSKAIDGVASFGVCFSFKKQQENYSGEPALFILIPIYNLANVTNTNDYHVDIDAYFRDMMSGTVSTTANSLGVFLNYDALRISYTTCIELKDNKTLNVRVLLFPGYIIQTTTSELFKGTIPSLRIPPALRNFQPTAFRRSVSGSGAGAALQVTQWSDEGFCYNGIISVGDDAFGIRFIFYDSKIVPVKGAIKAGTDSLIPTSQYKCIPLDKVRDISNNLVLVDPITKSRRTLQDELDADALVKAAELKDALPNADSNGPRQFALQFATIIAAGIVVVVFGFIFYKIGQRFHTTEKAIIAANAFTAAAVAANAGMNKSAPSAPATALASAPATAAAANSAPAVAANPAAPATAAANSAAPASNQRA